MDSLPPTVVDGELLAFLGRVLGCERSPQSNQELRRQIFTQDFSWQSLVDLACAHDLLPALVFSLKRRQLLPPLPSRFDPSLSDMHVTARLGAAYLEHLNRQADLREQLIKAVRALNQAGIVPTLLKGAVHLTLPQADWHEARAMRDLDILVRSGEAELAAETLVSLGYEADPAPPPLDRHLPEMHLKGRAGAIEIHTEALSFNARAALTTDEVWSYGERRSFEGVVFLVLSPPWHLMHGLLHHQLADRGHVRRMLALKGLWEFACVACELLPSDWNVVTQQAKERGIVSILSSWSVQANRLFGLGAPQYLLTATGIKHADATLRRAQLPLGVRRALFLGDKLSFAFAPTTIAQRYGVSSGAAALRHVAFLWGRRGPSAKRWLGR